MVTNLILLILVCFSWSSNAQEQVVVRINEQGLIKILKMAIRYNTATKSDRTVIVPKNIYEFKVPKESLGTNPVLSEVSNINLNQDLVFYLNTSPIKITGKVNPNSLKTQIFNTNSNGFDLRLNLELPKIEVSGESLSVCKDRIKRRNDCGNGLKASLHNFKLQTLNRSVFLNLVLRVRTSNTVTKISVRSIRSNLDEESGPDLDLNFGNLEIPKISIEVDGVETKLDTSELRKVILEQRDYLSKRLLEFAADFIANDLSEMMNIYLSNKEFANTYQLDKKESPVSFEIPGNDVYATRDNTQLYTPYVYHQYSKAVDQESNDPFELMTNEISKIIRSATFKLGLSKVATPLKKDLELHGIVDLILNGKTVKVSNSLSNRNTSLPAIGLNQFRNSDVNIAISEPLINGVLDLANSTGLFQEIFYSFSNIQGFNIKNLKLHFSGKEALVGVVNAEIDLKKIQSTNVSSWFKNNIAAFLERNNNNSVIYFPIEVSIIPRFKYLPNRDIIIELSVLSPFNNSQLINTFGYPSNISLMNEIVRQGVIEELKGSLNPYMNRIYSISLSNILNQSAVIFRPKSISIQQEAYILLNMDIQDIKFKSGDPGRI